ncbi:hypothetical protein [Azospirillum doebereinerae]
MRDDQFVAGGLAALTGLLQSRRVSPPQAGVARFFALGHRGPEPGDRALVDQRPFQFGRGAKNLEGEASLQAGGIDWIA